MSTPVVRHSRIPSDKANVSYRIVYADSLVWEPQGEQETMFAADPPRAVNPKILLAKLRPGQGIHVEMHAVKSIGRDHSKFSPVATATYRLMPHIQLLRPGDR